MPDDPNRISKTFCVFPWTQIHVSPVGVVKPCCVFDGALKNSDGSTMIVSDLSAQEIWNSDHLRDIRGKMLAGEPVKECAKCMEEERVHAVSDRIVACYFSDDVLRRIEESKANQNMLSEPPTSLNLKVGNTCNLKCRMCQPIDSCGVDAEFSKISEKHADFRNFDNASAFDYYTSDEPIEAMASWVSRPRSMENLKELLGKTRHLSLAGGEVAVTVEAMDLLRYCVESGISKRMSLDLSSNLTRISDELIEILSAFLRVRVASSIDGTEDVLEYIRFPAKWETVRKNFLKLISAPKNVTPVLAPTVQIYNILNIAELLEHFEQFESPKWTRETYCHLTLLFSPHFLSIRNLPKSVRMPALERLQRYYEKSRYARQEGAFKEKVKLLMATLQEDPCADNLKHLSHFLQYTKDLDESRNQDFNQCLPELASLLAKEGITPSYPDGPEGRSFSFHRYKAAGFLYQNDQRHQDAIDMFGKALVLDGSDAGALFGRGVSLKALGRYDEAETCFRRTYLIEPGHYYNLLELGFLERAKAHLSEARILFLKAKETEPAEKTGDCDRFIRECL